MSKVKKVFDILSVERPMDIRHIVGTCRLNRYAALDMSIINKIFDMLCMTVDGVDKWQ